MSEFDFSIEEIIRLRVKRGIATSPIDFSLIERSYERKKIEVLRDTFENIKGYLIWAEIDKYTLANIFKNQILPSYGYEWDGGRIVFIFDIVSISKGDTFKFVYKFIKNRKLVSYTRKGNQYIYIKKHGITFRLKE